MSCVEEAVGAAEQDVGLDTDRAQIAHAVLRRFRLQFACRADVRHQCQVNVERVLAADVQTELADRFEERHALDVADGAADFDEHDVHVPPGEPNRVLDLVGDVRNDLNGAAEVVAAPLLLNHRQVDLAGRPVAVARRHHAGEALVVTEIEVGLGAVVGDVDLAVLIRAHRPGIDVDVRVELLQGHRVAVVFEQPPYRGRRQTLAERRHHTAGDEDVFHGSAVRSLAHATSRTCRHQLAHALKVLGSIHFNRLVPRLNGTNPIAVFECAQLFE